MPTTPLTSPCPNCEATLSFEAISSMNPQRKPELRAAILDHSLQRQTCECGASVRLEPTFSYLDPERKQWIVARPYPNLGSWREHEAAAEALFAEALGAEAPSVAQEIGAGISPRVVFGWPALHEKLLIHDMGLDELTVECMKLGLMRDQQIVPEAGQELRLTGEKDEHLVIAILEPLTETQGDTYGCPKAQHERILSDSGPWQAVQSQFTGAFLDAQRLYFDG